jgi:hypothetical protein
MKESSKEATAPQEPEVDIDCGHAYAAHWRKRAEQAERRVQELERERDRLNRWLWRAARSLTRSEP